MGRLRSCNTSPVRGGGETHGVAMDRLEDFLGLTR